MNGGIVQNENDLLSRTMRNQLMQEFPENFFIAFVCAFPVK